MNLEEIDINNFNISYPKIDSIGNYFYEVSPKKKKKDIFEDGYICYDKHDIDDVIVIIEQYYNDEEKYKFLATSKKYKNIHCKVITNIYRSMINPEIAFKRECNRVLKRVRIMISEYELNLRKLNTLNKIKEIKL